MRGVPAAPRPRPESVTDALHACSARSPREALHQLLMRCTRYGALHPLRGATPEQKGCNADGSGAVPTDRVQCLQIGCSAPATTTTARNSCPHTLSGSPRRSHTATRCSSQQRVGIAAETKQELHPLRGSTPVTGRYTRYGALHPNRRGVMPTDRVQCPHDKSKSGLPCASSLTTSLGQYHAAVENSVEHRAVPHLQIPPTSALSLYPTRSSPGGADARLHSVIEVVPASQDSPRAVDGLAFRSERPTPPAAASLHEPTEAPCGSLLFRRRQDARRALGENPLDDARQARRHFAATQREEAHARPRGDSHAFGPAS